MRTQFLGLAVCLVAFAMNAVADEPAKTDGQVREVELKGLKLPEGKGMPQKPTVVTSEDELKKAVPDEDAQKQIKKDVDFSKQQVLVFAWSGSGQDMLTYKEEKADKGLAIVFTYQPGRTRDLRPHHKVVVLPRDATWSFAKK